MTDREKIIEIIKRNGTYNGRSLSFNYYVIQPDDLADALIAAGIGGTTSLIVENEVLQRDVDNLTRTLEEGTEEFKAEKHRAEVAERALYNACCEQNKHWCIQCDFFAECDTSNEMCIKAKKHTEELVKQAEKELAEEKKDD